MDAQDVADLKDVVKEFCEGNKEKAKEKLKSLLKKIKERDRKASA